MANYKTGAQRYNDRMDKVFSEAKEKKAEHEKGESKAKEKKENLARKMKVGGKSQKFYRESKGLLEGGFPDKPKKDSSYGSWSGQPHMKGK